MPAFNNLERFTFREGFKAYGAFRGGGVFLRVVFYRLEGGGGGGTFSRRREVGGEALELSVGEGGEGGVGQVVACEGGGGGGAGVDAYVGAEDCSGAWLLLLPVLRLQLRPVLAFALDSWPRLLLFSLRVGLTP